MLIKVTNFCSFGCSHCMENSTPAGLHMTREIFEKSLDFTARTEKMAWDLGIDPLILLSGGECTEHPEIISFIEEVYRRKMKPLLISNGSWLRNEELKKSILRPEWLDLEIQIQNDPKFYPTRVPRILDSRITYRPPVGSLVPLGRMTKGKSWQGVPYRTAPTSFNLRSATRSLKDFEKAVCFQRTRAAFALSGACSPSISFDGVVRAGETTNCFEIGTVDSTNEELTKAIINMTCNRCGLETNLSQEHKRAIGASTLYAPNESRA